MENDRFRILLTKRTTGLCEKKRVIALSEPVPEPSH